MKISILHISDIHKAAKDKYDYLLSSLALDYEKYKEEGITPPQLIVVSGDIIQGSGSLDIETANKEIAQQYTDASFFLEELCNLFLKGNKARIVIAPGNHDVNRAIAMKSMKKMQVSPTDNKNMAKELWRSGSNIRWNWEDLSFYKIENTELYNSRFDNFCNFYSDFYEQKRSYNADPEKQSSIIDFEEFNLAVVDFNSCNNLDNLNTSGCIHPSCLVSISTELRKLHNKGRLIIGVWHHHVNGLPCESNYLDKRILSQMINNHINLGIHGHQHVCGIINEYKDFFDERKLPLISAGTLYGGSKELPYGAKRQYNVIEIEYKLDSTEIVVHSREDKSHSCFEFIDWGKGNIETLELGKNIIQIPVIRQPSIDSVINEINREAELTKDYSKAINSLLKYDTNNPFVQKTILHYAQMNNDNEFIFSFLDNPTTIDEAIILLDCVSELMDISKIENVLKIPFIAESKNASIEYKKNELQFYIKTKKNGKY